jgi:non-lysosomal glucosylceramidase
LQVNEVLVGSAWVYVAMLAEYGLHEKARLLADRMVDFQYVRAGLQFRTPAAWDGEGQFRAPLNMRPLSIAWLHYPG